MPSKAALEAFKKLEIEKIKGLPADQVQSALESAQRRVNAIAKKSTIFDEEAEKAVLRFSHEELKIGRQLGVGGFCAVNEIKKINVPTPVPDPPLRSREYMSLQCIREEGGPRYAIKELAITTLADKKLFAQGIADIVIEARMLAVIQHNNIIKIRGFADCGYFNKGFFILMDRLQITLDKQLSKWSEEKRKCTGLLSKFSQKKKEAAEDLKSSRFDALLGIASAIKFLHSKNIIYRDLKPDNIGFDVRENVKVFDFGLAAEVIPSQADGDGTYKLTGFTGSPLYMAPEVAKSLPYNLKADTYSFGILFWQIMALKNPFPKFTMKTLEEFVVNGVRRPKLKKDWSGNVKELMQSCWDGDFSKRPEFHEIKEQLHNEFFSSSQESKFGIDIVDVSRSSYTYFLSN